VVIVKNLQRAECTSIQRTGIRFNQTSETVCTDGRVPGEIRDRVPDCGAGNWEGPM